MKWKCVSVDMQQVLVGELVQNTAVDYTIGVLEQGSQSINHQIHQVARALVHTPQKAVHFRDVQAF